MMIFGSLAELRTTYLRTVNTSGKTQITENNTLARFVLLILCQVLEPMVVQDFVTHINAGRYSIDTYDTFSTPSQDDLEDRSGAPSYGFPSHRNSTGNDRVDANRGPNSLSKNAGLASVDQRNARSRISNSSSSGQASFYARPARGISRDDEYGHRSQHKPAELHVRRSKYYNPSGGVPARAQVNINYVLQSTRVHATYARR